MWCGHGITCSREQNRKPSLGEAFRYHSDGWRRLLGSSGRNSGYWDYGLGNSRFGSRRLGPPTVKMVTTIASGGIVSGISNASFQIWRDPARKELNFRSIGTSVVLGGVGAGLGSWMYGPGGFFAWNIGEGLVPNLAKFGGSQVVWSIYGAYTSPINSWANGTTPEAETSLARYNQAGNAARALFWNYAGSRLPVLQTGGMVQTVTDKFVISPIQAGVGSNLFPKAGAQ